MGFAESVKANCDKSLLAINDKCNAIVNNLFTSIVVDTPVDTGLLKNSWYPVVGQSFSTVVGASPDKSGSDSITRIGSILQSDAFYGKDGVVTMTNNQNYSYQAEYLGWTFTKPYAMVITNLQRVASENK